VLRRVPVDSAVVTSNFLSQLCRRSGANANALN
jgi:hypothetical protein